MSEYPDWSTVSEGVRQELRARQSIDYHPTYRGVLLLPDGHGGYDERVTEVIDRIFEEGHGRQLNAAGHQEGSVSFAWNQSVPPAYREGEGVAVTGDYWYVRTSRVKARWVEPWTYLIELES